METDSGFGGSIVGVLGKPKTIVCNVTGAVPKVTLKWILNGVDVTAKATTVVSSDGSNQSSSLTFTPTKSDQDAELKCSTSNEAARRLGLPDIEQKATFIINTHQSKAM